MSGPPTTASKSRRALLAGALGGLGAWAASAISRASPLRGADGEAVLVGGEYVSTSVTKIAMTGTTGPAIQGDHQSGTGIRGTSQGGYGVYGSSVSSLGVYGLSSASQGVRGKSITDHGVLGLSTSGTGARGSSEESYGVAGDSASPSAPAVLGYSSGAATGVLGFSGTGEPPPAKDKTGVYGQATQDANSRGVWGRSNSGYGVEGQATSGTGVYGTSQSGWGVHGTSFYDVGVAGNSSATDRPAVRGRAAGNSTGVLGFSGVATQPPTPALTGVYGYAAGRGSAGVRGETTSGLGVRALATTGVAVLAESGSGYALYTAGRLKAEKVSGVATISAGSTSKTVSPGVDITSASFVLLTPRANLGSRGLWFTLNATDNKFTIRISSSRSSNTPVAWLLLG